MSELVPITGNVLVSLNCSWKTSGQTGGVGSAICLWKKKRWKADMIRRKYRITSVDQIVITG